MATVDGALEQLAGDLQRARARELLRDLLDDDPDIRAAAVAGLVRSGFVGARGPALVCVAAPVLDGRTKPDPAVQAALEGGLERFRLDRVDGAALHLVRPAHGVVVVGLDAGAPRPEPAAVAAEVHAAVAAALEPLGWGVVVGAGQVVERLATVVASHRQACEAVRVATAVPSVGQAVAWSSLGVWRVLSRLPVAELGLEGLHPGLARLLAADARDALLETLERYLDLAGDAKATSAALNLHRASLYYRLHKIEEVADVDLKSGADRLGLHLGLKLARVAGLLA